jgi:hypothetical protein
MNLQGAVQYVMKLRKMRDSDDDSDDDGNKKDPEENHGSVR